MTERLVFVAAAALSGYVFWRRFGRVLGAIRAARPEPGRRCGGARRFILEVLLQAKVIRERPWPGIAHAVVFWGFCAFALVTANHLASGVGLAFLSEAGAFGRVYFALAAALAVAVAAAITGLAARRFIAQPRWLGAVSGESGLIALLIFALMTSYLAEYLLHPPGIAARALWWTHTAALLVFLPLIPRTKHLHLLLGPFAVLFGRDGFAQVPPLAGEEDFGLAAGRDLTRRVALQSYSCVECGRCTEHCPAYNTGKILNPKEIILALRRHLDEDGPAGEQPLIGTRVSQEAVFQCTTCGACEFQCPVGIQHLPILIGLRRGAVNTGRWEDERGTKLFLNLERTGNVFGFAPAERENFIRKHELPLFDGAQDYCLWLGCMGAYDPRGRQIVLALAGVLRSLGVTFGVLKREKCSGDAARRLGNDLVFGELAEFNFNELRAARAARIVSICPHCVRTLGEDYREAGGALRIEHHSELLARHRAGLHGSAGDRIVFHDPCYLGRYRGVYQAPREVAALGGRLVEAPRARRRSFCCGAGGGLAFLGDEKGRRISVERAEELVSTGAATIAAACPFCHTMLQDALGGLGGSAPKLVDIAEIAAAAGPAGRHPAL